MKRIINEKPEQERLYGSSNAGLLSIVALRWSSHSFSFSFCLFNIWGIHDFRNSIYQKNENNQYIDICE